MCYQTSLGSNSQTPGLKEKTRQGKYVKLVCKIATKKPWSRKCFIIICCKGSALFCMNRAVALQLLKNQIFFNQLKMDIITFWCFFLHLMECIQITWRKNEKVTQNDLEECETTLKCLNISSNSLSLIYRIERHPELNWKYILNCN